MLIDTHAHLYWDVFEKDLDQVIKRSIEAGVTTIINVGVDVEKSKIALRQAQGKLANYPGFTAYSTIGIHPHEAIKYSSDLPAGRQGVSIHEDIEKLRKLYQTRLDQPFDSAQNKIVAVGECGLDYFFDRDFIPPTLSPLNLKERQQKLFLAQINLAKELNLPLIIHCRDDRSQNPDNSEAWDEVLKMVGTHPAILHCYSGLPKTTNLVLASPNLLVSFAATLTYPKNEYLKVTAKLLPLDRIIVETDCPFLPPQPKRGQRNEPANVLETVQLIADLKNIPLEGFEEKIMDNANRILKLV
jgi:TatD DNase family protein